MSLKGTQWVWDNTDITNITIQWIYYAVLKICSELMNEKEREDNKEQWYLINRGRWGATP